MDSKRIFPVCILSAALWCSAFPSPQATLRGHVTDAETGEIIPCTVTIRSSDGSVLIESQDFNRGFRSSGVFEKAVPAGETVVTIRRGFDYGGVTRTVELPPGGRKELEFKLRRRTPFAISAGTRVTIMFT